MPLRHAVSVSIGNAMVLRTWHTVSGSSTTHFGKIHGIYGPWVGPKSDGRPAGRMGDRVCWPDLLVGPVLMY